MLFMSACMVISFILWRVGVFTSAGSAVLFVGVELFLYCSSEIILPIMRVNKRARRMMRILDGIDDLENMTDEEADCLEDAARKLQKEYQAIGIKPTMAEEVIESINTVRKHRMKEGEEKDI